MSQKLIDRIVAHEGSKRFVYQDSLGYWTAGIGRNLDPRSQKGLTIEEQHYLLNNDIKSCIKDLSAIPVYIMLDEVRKEVLVELVFNMGIARVLKFKRMIAALQDHDYTNAVEELQDSLWAKQVQPARVKDLSYRLLHGKYQ
jgi:lysozyme